ncbi:L,D-transpeptidase family protein [Streptomyces bullii]|uniref:L,D-transpeptidase family protein n=1 Tax=Streptomyces bullii TaxID=349910 RepID=A0ABW0UTA7_9ACTN
MRTTGMGRALAASVALAAVTGCTVQTAGGDGERRSPVRIEIPSGTPTPPGARYDGRPSEGSRGSDGGRPSAGGPKLAPPPAPARVLWSRGDTGRDVRELQARLRQVAWLLHGPTGTYDERTQEAVRGFQGKRGLPRTGEADTVTWQRLVGMTREPGRWELYLMGGQPADRPDPRCLTGRVLCVSKSSRTLRWMVDGRTLSTMAVRFGSEYTPTREGVFRVYWKSRDHWSTLYDSPMPYAMFFSGGQAVHFSPDFAARGYAGASHGCVNVGDEAAIADLYAQVRNGDKVVVHW